MRHSRPRVLIVRAIYVLRAQSRAVAVNSCGPGDCRRSSSLNSRAAVRSARHCRIAALLFGVAVMPCGERGTVEGCLQNVDLELYVLQLLSLVQPPAPPDKAPPMLVVLNKTDLLEDEEATQVQARP
jgi:hypothetical protein